LIHEEKGDDSLHAAMRREKPTNSSIKKFYSVTVKDFSICERQKCPIFGLNPSPAMAGGSSS
jgi:hypothetical protein